MKDELRAIKRYLDTLEVPEGGATENGFEMFKRELRGYNLAMPDLTDKEYLGNGVYRYRTQDGITMDYDVYNGHVILNGTITPGIVILELGLYRNVVPNDSIVSFSYYYISGTFENDTSYNHLFVNSVNTPDAINLKEGLNYTTNFIKENYEFNFSDNITLPRIFLGAQGGTITFNNFTFKIQLEKGDTATPYTLPGQIPQYKIETEAPTAELLFEIDGVMSDTEWPHILDTKGYKIINIGYEVSDAQMGYQIIGSTTIQANSVHEEYEDTGGKEYGIRYDHGRISFKINSDSIAIQDIEGTLTVYGLFK